MKKIALLLMLLLVPVFAAADMEDFSKAKELIESGVTCNELSDEQLELMGDYYMGQMHPGSAHEIMDNMMGGEGSDSLKLVHINMAKRLYCNENVYIGYGMMGSGMMNFGINQGGKGNMMGYYGGYGMGLFGWLFGILILVALILLIVWLWQQIDRKGKRR